MGKKKLSAHIENAHTAPAFLSTSWWKVRQVQAVDCYFTSITALPWLCGGLILPVLKNPTAWPTGCAGDAAPTARGVSSMKPMAI